MNETTLWPTPHEEAPDRMDRREMENHMADVCHLREMDMFDGLMELSLEE